MIRDGTGVTRHSLRLGRQPREFMPGMGNWTGVFACRVPAEAGRAKLEASRASSEIPADSDAANRRRGATGTQRQREARQCDAAHGGEADPEVFQREILPKLQSVSVGAMAKATGLSEGYCSFIRRGIKVPHGRHWVALRRTGAQHTWSRNR